MTYEDPFIYHPILSCQWWNGHCAEERIEEPDLGGQTLRKGCKVCSFACKDSYKDIVDEYFKRNPLNRIINVCHNNCAVLESFPKTPMPPFDKKLLGTGFIAVHILTNEKGTPVFARALNGQSPMRAIFQARSCEATFRRLTNNRQRVLYLCVDQDCSLPQPVQ